ncbi:MAG: DUF4143 domain-containing protein [Bifidobacteriaceae bacterium]|nr:DUF4143 domain-containing protein [Bifidobacteriaceae bacterium]
MAVGGQTGRRHRPTDLAAPIAQTALGTPQLPPRERSIRDSGPASYLVGVNPSSLRTGGPDESRAGAILETFVAAEIAKRACWSQTRPELSHFRDQSGPEDDVIASARDGRIVGIEVKAAASASARDFRSFSPPAGCAGRPLRRRNRPAHRRAHASLRPQTCCGAHGRPLGAARLKRPPVRWVSLHDAAPPVPATIRPRSVSGTGTVGLVPFRVWPHWLLWLRWQFRLGASSPARCGTAIRAPTGKKVTSARSAAGRRSGTRLPKPRVSPSPPVIRTLRPSTGSERVIVHAEHANRSAANAILAQVRDDQRLARRATI